MVIWLMSATMFVAGVSAQPVFRERNEGISFRDSLLYAILERANFEQTEDYLPVLILSEQGIHENYYRETLLQTEAKFAKLPKRGKNFKLYVQSVFRFVHGTFLRKYVEYPTFAATLTKGNYDCLTATSLFAVIFKKLNIRFEIIEIKEHIYMLVYDDLNRRVLIESTDPVNGCVLFEADIHERLKEYEHKNRKIVSDLITEDDYSQTVDFKQLAGLHFFNQAVKAFNLGDFPRSVDFLKTADTLYPSKRISALMVLSLDAISSKRNLHGEQKRAIMEKYKKHYENVKDTHAIVSAN